MPIYEYHCKSCAHDFEEIVSGSGDAAPACPSCGSEQTQKLMSCACRTRNGGGGDYDGAGYSGGGGGGGCSGCSGGNCAACH